MYRLGMHVFFPTFIMEVDTATDCHLRYEPIRCACRFADLDYVQPKCVYDKSASVMTTTIQPLATIEQDDNPVDLPTYVPHWQSVLLLQSI